MAAKKVAKLIRRVSSDEHGAINLSQASPTSPALTSWKDARPARSAMNVNQYAITWVLPDCGTRWLAKVPRWYGLPVDPMTQVTVACGATEAMGRRCWEHRSGDEVVIFEPFYEKLHGPDAILCDARPVFVPCPSTPRSISTGWPRHSAETRAIIVLHAQQSTGRVLSAAELEAIADLCRPHDVFAVTDEIYEHIYYEGEHIPIADAATWRSTITISGASRRSASPAGVSARIISPPDVTGAIRKVHDFLTVGAPAPLQRRSRWGWRSWARITTTG